MHRNLVAALSAVTAVAVLGVSACSSGASKTSSSTASLATPGASNPGSSPGAPLPAPEALTDVLAKLSDPNVPGGNKVNLIEGATPESAANLDKFTNALRDGGYLPMTFTATDIAWSDKNPSYVTATINVKTSHESNRGFTFPMEFTPFQGGWLLSKKTAEMLLALSNSTPPPTPPG